MNKFTIAGAVMTLVVVALAMWAYWPAPSAPAVVPPIATSTPPATPEPTSTQTIIGTSVEKRLITAHTFGTGETDLLFVGGIHGGYEANTVEFAKAAIQQLQTDQTVVPESVTLHIIPNLNPDGYALPTSAPDAERRFNANNVDLNRNFDCRWEPTGVWRGVTMSAGAAPFSEPEAAALRDYVLATNPSAAVFWHSKASAVYTSECGGDVMAATDLLMETYAAAADYTPAGLWTAYPVTGDVEGWLASIGIPAITVEFETRDSVEWERNWAGLLATLELYR